MLFVNVMVKQVPLVHLPPRFPIIRLPPRVPSSPLRSTAINAPLKIAGHFAFYAFWLVKSVIA